MKNHKEVLENLIKVVEEEIKDCKKYNKELFKEKNIIRAGYSYECSQKEVD